MCSDRERGDRGFRSADLARVGVPILVACAVAAAWHFTPLGELTPDIQDALSKLRAVPMAPAVVVGVFVLGGLVVAPVSVLILGSVIAFGPVRGSLYALLGALASAAVLFAIGRAIGRSSLDRLLGGRVERIAEILGRHGILTVAVARNIPVAPYSVVNLVAGALPLGFRDYIVGTLIGFLPALVALALIGDRLTRLVENPDQGSWLTLVGLVAVLAVAGVVAGKWLLRRSQS